MPATTDEEILGVRPISPARKHAAFDALVPGGHVVLVKNLVPLKRTSDTVRADQVGWEDLEPELRRVHVTRP